MRIRFLTYLFIGVLCVFLVSNIRIAKVISITNDSMAEIKLTNYSITTWEIPVFIDSIYHSKIVASYSFEGEISVSYPYTLIRDTLSIDSFSSKTLYMPVSRNKLNSSKYKKVEYVIPSLSFQIGSQYNKIRLVSKFKSVPR